MGRRTKGIVQITPEVLIRVSYVSSLSRDCRVTGSVWSSSTVNLILCLPSGSYGVVYWSVKVRIHILGDLTFVQQYPTEH